MMGDPASLSDPAALAVMVTGVVAVVLRLSILMFLLPSIGDLAIPARFRLGIVLALTAAVAPSVVPTQADAIVQIDLIPLLVFESVIGFALGFTFRTLSQVLSIAGTIISQSASLSQIFGPGFDLEPNPTVSTLLVLTGSALFVSLDFHTYTVALLMESYSLFPLGDVPDTGALAKWATSHVAGAFGLAVSISLPFILISFLYYVVLGLMNQAMPQMMVMFVGVPANVMAGLLLLALSFSTIMVVWLAAVNDALGGFW